MYATPNNLGYIYVINIDNSNYYKIGQTSCKQYIKQRVSCFQSKCAWEATLVAQAETYYPVEVEREIHREFATCKIVLPDISSRELFQLTMNEIAELKVSIAPDRMFARSLKYIKRDKINDILAA